MAVEKPVFQSVRSDPRTSAEHRKTPVATPDRLQDKAKHGAQPPASKSFDPYNSGAFDKRQTWERVIRK